MRVERSTKSQVSSRLAMLVKEKEKNSNLKKIMDFKLVDQEKNTDTLDNSLVEYLLH